jgi:hypothetical protein
MRRAGLGQASALKPGVLVRSMVQYQLSNDPQAALVGFVDHRASAGVDDDGARSHRGEQVGVAALGRDVEIA